MSNPIELSNAALVFADAATGQAYVRTLNEWEAKLVSAQLAALDEGEMKVTPVHPIVIRKMVRED